MCVFSAHVTLLHILLYIHVQCTLYMFMSWLGTELCLHAALYICVDCFVFKVIAGKIVQKSLLTKSYHKEWMAQEIRFLKIWLYFQAILTDIGLNFETILNRCQVLDNCYLP